MKKKDIQTLRQHSTVEWENLVKDSNETLRKLRFDLAAGKVKDISKIKELKKKVARVKTFIKEHEHQGK